MMHLVYYDEAGDDGHPAASSKLFVLTAVYLHYMAWKGAFEKVLDFRRYLRAEFRIPVKTEFHTKPFLLNKNPYRNLSLSDSVRLSIINSYCDLIASLEIKVINIVIVKPRIIRPDYQVLDRALTYSIQRIENDLNPRVKPEARFMIISDEGRIGKMRKTSRRIQRINYIPSKFSPEAYRQEVEALIEDPLPKKSSESYFIQTADLIASVVYLRALIETGVDRFPNRMPDGVNSRKVADWLDRLAPSLNLKACERNPYGIMYHPQ